MLVFVPTKESQGSCFSVVRFFVNVSFNLSLLCAKLSCVMQHLVKKTQKFNWTLPEVLIWESLPFWVQLDPTSNGHLCPTHYHQSQPPFPTSLKADDPSCASSRYDYHYLDEEPLKSRVCHEVGSQKEWFSACFLSLPLFCPFYKTF